MIDKFMDIINKYVLPVASKIGNNKFLVALRDSFIGTMPIIMTGSIAVLLNAFFVDLPSQFGFEKITETFQWLVNINDLVFSGSIAVASLFFIYALGVNVAKIYKVNELSAGLVALSSFIISIGNSFTKTVELSPDLASKLGAVAEVEGLSLVDNELMITLEGLLPGGQLSSNGYFTAIIIGFASAMIFSYFMNKNWTIKLPDTVPPAIATPFLSIIPAFIALYSVGIFTSVIGYLTGGLFIDWIFKVLQTPLLGMSQSYLAVVSVAVLTQVFWFFGLHGGNVMAPIMDGVFDVAGLANLEAYQLGKEIPYIWTKASFGSFVFYGTLGLIIAIFLKSKRNKHYREVAKLGVVPSLFNIGEPIKFGIPTVLNPLLLIPSLLTPAVMSTIAYFATKFGLVAPVTQNVTWVMPPILYGFFSTAFDWRSIVLSIVNLAAATLIYLPFVMMAENPEAGQGVESNDESNDESNN